MNDYKFGNFLCELREAKGMTQLEIANMLDVTPAAVSKWENGESKPKVETLFKLAEIFDVTAEELMSGEADKSHTKEEKPIFSLNVDLTFENFLDYSAFWMLKSPQGKKQVRESRIAIAAVIILGITVIFLSSGVNNDTFIRAGFFVVLLIIAEILLPKFMSSQLRRQLNSQIKSSNKPFTSLSVTEFYNDFFTDTTSDDKKEQKYLSVEIVSIVENKIIFIQVSGMYTYFIPVSSFASEAEYQSFITFIKSKCRNVEVYKNKAPF